MDSAQIAADQGNALDRAAEDEFKKKLREAKMEIYTPSAAEKQQWQRIGEQIWETQGAKIEKPVLEAMTKLR
jgi:TRAP-type C4-dicarboxylate transport system substrate-binding protein